MDPVDSAEPLHAQAGVGDSFGLATYSPAWISVFFAYVVGLSVLAAVESYVSRLVWNPDHTGGVGTSRLPADYTAVMNRLNVFPACRAAEPRVFRVCGWLHRFWPVSWSVLFLAVLSACQGTNPFREIARPLTPHESYAESLREVGLDGTALGRDWLAAADSALRSPGRVSLPFRETGYFSADQAGAVGYRISAQRGQRLTARVDVESSVPTRFFLDLFEVSADTARAPEHLASTDSAQPFLQWEPSRDGDYVLRLQPELLRATRYTVTLQSEPALAFPVQGRTNRAIGSFFGAKRDGGRREHHGVDIFASRGTPAVAASEGYVTRVSTTPRGGKVVWLRDAERSLNLYYAHLDSQTVAAGARVRVGDTLGLVGNTGNARSTPPHLHFGIYRRGEGPIDPLVWIRESREDPPAVTADPSRLGAWVRVTPRALPLRSAPLAHASAVAELPRHTAVRVTGASGSWYRVVLPDGRGGYLAARSTESASAPLRRERLAQGTTLRDRPAPTAVAIDSLSTGATVPVLGRFADFLLVEAPGGRMGWVTAE